MLLRRPNNCGEPTNNRPTENKIQGKNSGATVGATVDGDDGREKVKT